MKSNCPKNTSDTSEGPKFKVGDLVYYVYRSSDDPLPDIGLVIEVSKIEFVLPEESSFIDHFYEYDILWTNRGYATLMFEMFLEKYIYQE